jgi:predicted DNA-binding protein with PD1-like motif
MRTKEIRTGGRRVLVVVCDKGEEAVEAVTQTVRTHRIGAAQVTAVGAFSSAELGYFDRDRREYAPIPVTGQVEVLSLLGDIAVRDGVPEAHLHAVLGREDGSTMGGHLLRGEVWPTLEVIITEVAEELGKRFDPETGLALLNPEPHTRGGRRP